VSTELVLSCEWSADGCLGNATPQDVLDPDGIVVAMNLCVNCLRDHDVAEESPYEPGCDCDSCLEKAPDSGYPL
jgi:hypothetical protein